MFYRPADGHGLPHDPFKAIVTPRPIGWISSLDAQGRARIGELDPGECEVCFPDFDARAWRASV